MRVRAVALVLRAVVLAGPPDLPLGSICPFCAADLVNDRVIGIMSNQRGRPDIRWTSRHDCKENQSDCTHTQGKIVRVKKRMDTMLKNVPKEEKALFLSELSAYLTAHQKKRFSKQESVDEEGDGEEGDGEALKK